MYLGYCDESISEDKRFVVVAGILLHDKAAFDALESVLADVIDREVPEGMQESFEFHASDLYHTRGRFTGMDVEVARQILESSVKAIAEMKVPIVWGAVDTERFKTGIYGNAAPITVGFRICMEGVENWFKEKQKDEMGLLVFDNRQKQDPLRKELQAAFRDYRKPVKSIWDDRGKLAHIHDDLYFGDSAYSYGIQAADICAYFIRRHLDGKENTEYLYELLKPHIVYQKLVPAPVLGRPRI